MVKDTSKPKDLPEEEVEEPTPEEEEEPTPEPEEPKAQIEPEIPEEKEDNVTLKKRLKGYDKALKESREREKSLKKDLIESRKEGMSDKDAAAYELETIKQRNAELENATQYYEGEIAKRDLLKNYKYASKFPELLYGTPEEMKEQADKIEKFVEERSSGGKDKPTPPPVDLDNPPLEGEEIADAEFAQLPVEEMRKRLPVKK